MMSAGRFQRCSKVKEQGVFPRDLRALAVDEELESPYKPRTSKELLSSGVNGPHGDLRAQGHLAWISRVQDDLHGAIRAHDEE